jgi:hypothetical protein
LKIHWVHVGEPFGNVWRVGQARSHGGLPNPRKKGVTIHDLTSTTR